MTTDAARHAAADALILVGNLVAAGHGEPRRSLMIVHVDRWQADDLIAVMDEVRDYVDISGHENYQGWLPGNWRLHLIVDRTVDPSPELLAALDEPWHYPASGDEARRILHEAGARS